MITPEMKELLKFYNEGLKKYKKGEFKEALLEFEKAIEILQKILTFDPNHTQAKKSIHNLVRLLEKRKNSKDKK